MNPCKCGFFPDQSKCRCSPTQIRRYLSRVSGPFLDRIDIGVEVPRSNLKTDNMAGEKTLHNESSAVMRERVMRARTMQNERFEGEDISYNAEMTRRQIDKYCRLSEKDAEFLNKVEINQGISARGHGKILKVARTLADLDGETEISRSQLAEAIGFRTFESKYWGNM